MSIDFVKTQLGRLSYTDMKRLATDIAQQLWGSDQKRVSELADILASLPLDDPAAHAADELALREVFRRKLNISICLVSVSDDNALWEVCLTSQNLSTQAPRLREALSQLLDIVVARNALRA